MAQFWDTMFWPNPKRHNLYECAWRVVYLVNLKSLWHHYIPQQPWLPYWPKQRQITQMRAFNPTGSHCHKLTRYVFESEFSCTMKNRYASSNKFEKSHLYDKNFIPFNVHWLSEGGSLASDALQLLNHLLRAESIHPARAWWATLQTLTHHSRTESYLTVT